MPVRVACPHCHQKLGVPRKKVGALVACPSCGESFTALESGETRTEDGVVVAPRSASTAAAVLGGSVARLVTARAPAETVEVGSDGKLQALTLREPDEKTPDDGDAKPPNSRLTVAVVLMSLLMSIALLFLDPEPATQSRLRDRIEARDAVAAFLPEAGTPDAPYQSLIREGLLAAQRGDRATELLAWRRLLELLHVEHRSRFAGVTGSPARDDELKDLLTTLLGRD